jgi:hypothetical protein
MKILKMPQYCYLLWKAQAINVVQTMSSMMVSEGLNDLISGDTAPSAVALSLGVNF